MSTAITIFYLGSTYSTATCWDSSERRNRGDYVDETNNDSSSDVIVCKAKIELRQRLRPEGSVFVSAECEVN
jgi:hypothetical protein